MAFDLAIRGGLVVDGMGVPAQHMDIGIKAGRIVSIGKLQEGSSRVIDATGLVVAPGFIDPHTHYDAQVCWDTSLSPSPWHGVTTVLMGNCGVGIAPTRAAGRIPAMQDLVNVEGMPYDVMSAGITWDWESFPEFMRATANRRPAANVAFLAPLTPFRYYVMGRPPLSGLPLTESETGSDNCSLTRSLQAPSDFRRRNCPITWGIAGDRSPVARRIAPSFASTRGCFAMPVAGSLKSPSPSRCRSSPIATLRRLNFCSVKAAARSRGSPCSTVTTFLWRVHQAWPKRHTSPHWGRCHRSVPDR